MLLDGKRRHDDLLLAIGHHLLVFSLLGVLVAELVMLRPVLNGGEVRRLARIDAHYGALAGLVIAVGVARVFFGIKGAEYYTHNHWFWAKMAAFVVVGLLSIAPTVTFIRWRGRLKRDEAYLPAPAEIARVRRLVTVQLAVFTTIPALAAAMARA
ncbi:MAG: DUF2214 family protein [Phenylobacterium sp.]|uniref:DUF2214 family protein n=1 Tax=Phenylobacterium sp. TaxID=1871053 RepID=UPI002732B49E|nr:DUF2214 family protein [Phenylobacterium sp.]MDP3174996.1 DUF2214 family protein [Phenylobacterium sp.]